MAGGKEVELKLRLPPGAVGALLAHPALAAAKRGRRRRERLVATYFDTPDLRLAGQGLGLRVRREGGRWIQTIKARGGSDGVLAHRDELAWDLGRATRRPPPDLARAAGTDLGRRVVAAAEGIPLVAGFTAEIDRTTIPLAFADGTRALAAIDVGVLRTGRGAGKRDRVCELELELEDGQVARLYDIALALAATVPLAAEVRSKAQRGWALIAPRASVPVRAAALAYAGDATATEALAAVLRNALAQVEGNVDGAIGSDDPEWIHQLRVGVRRLRCALPLARPPAFAVPPDGLREAWRDVAQALGRARDLDVFVTQTLPRLAVAAPAAPEVAGWLGTLEAAAREAQAGARRAARGTLTASAFQRLLLATGAFAAMPPPGDVATTVRGFANDVLRRRHRRLRRAGAGLDGATDAERHVVRIAAKKLRYALEFFAPADPRGRTQAVRKALVGLQEQLGALNDVAVAAELAATLAPGSPAAAFVRGWALAETAAGRKGLARAWRTFAASKSSAKD